MMIAVFPLPDHDHNEKDAATIQTVESLDDLESVLSEGSVESIDLLEVEGGNDDNSYHWYDDDVELHHNVQPESCIERALSGFRKVLNALITSGWNIGITEEQCQCFQTDDFYCR
jgi:hypothetical protein